MISAFSPRALLVAATVVASVPTAYAAAPSFASTSSPASWEVAMSQGGADGAFASFPTTGFAAAVDTGRTSEGIGWIANNSSGTNACCTGTWTFFVFRQSFDLTGYDPSTASLSFQWAADDSGEGFAERGSWRPKFSLNGGSLVPGNWPGGPTYDLSPVTTLTGGFVNGVNTISFYVEGNGVTDGFALRSLGLTAQVVPEPGTWALFGIGLAALGVARRRPVRNDAA